MKKNTADAAKHANAKILPNLLLNNFVKSKAPIGNKYAKRDKKLNNVYFVSLSSGPNPKIAFIPLIFQPRQHYIDQSHPN